MQMNVEQTADWIRILGFFKGWLDADNYFKTFKDNDITGDMLPLISLKMLEIDLEITNIEHRLTIRSLIDELFAQPKSDRFGSPRAISQPM